MVDWRTYEIHKCQNCQLLFSSPDPTAEELDQFYQGFLHRKPEKAAIAKKTTQKIKELRRVFQLPEGTDLTDKKMLDYGGGTGLAYHAARVMGLDSYYQDIDQQSIDFVQSAFGLPEDKFITNFEDSTLKFDYIFVDNVIEHVIDPGAFVQMLYNQLNPDGLLVFKTPNANNTSSYFYPRTTIEGYFANALKYNSWSGALKVYFLKVWHCDPPRHLYSFSKKSFEYLTKDLQIPKEKYEISFYQHPLFEFSFMKSFLFLDRKYEGLRSILTRIIVFPVIIVELFSKVLQFILYQLGLLSPVGIILSLRK